MPAYKRKDSAMSNAVATPMTPQQRGWITALLFERGIDHKPDEVATDATEASAFIKACLQGRVGSIQTITEEQAATIRRLEAELGPAPDGKQREMPTDRAGANRYIRRLNQVKFARADDAMSGKLALLGIEVNTAKTEDSTEYAVQNDTEDVPF